MITYWDLWFTGSSTPTILTPEEGERVIQYFANILVPIRGGYIIGDTGTRITRSFPAK